MVMVFSVGVVSAEDVKINVNDLIIEQALEQYDMTNTSDFSASRVQSTSVNGRCASNEFAIQSTTFNSNMIEATTIIPYKVLDDGNNTMPYDRMVRFMNAILDGMHINYHIEFITNGQVRSYDSSVPIAGK